MFSREEVLIANAMIELEKKAENSFQKYFCFWVAFNNIYTLLSKRLAENTKTAKRNKLSPALIKENGEVIYRLCDWGYQFPKISSSSEREQIRASAIWLEEDVKEKIVNHPNIHFFVDRLPKGVKRLYDSRGQLINGVLNVTRTIDNDYPIWSPINKQVYERVVNGDLSEINILIEQIIMVLYTIRNNLVHGDKNPNEANDLDVVEKALPILEIVVNSFIYD